MSTCHCVLQLVRKRGVLARSTETICHLVSDAAASHVSGVDKYAQQLMVLDGAGLDVDFYLSSPRGHILASDHRKSDGVHTVETEEGDYMFCFDNTFSAVSEKIIFFELILDNMDDGEDPEDWKEYVHGTDLLDMKLEDIMDTINSVKARLGKSVQIQTVLRAFEARDRNLQESNYERVNIWSCTNLVVMVIVSGIQVYLLRSLFDDKRKTRT
ncbi:transmembrane emp24 domain-containing protein 5 isoform X2 [Chanos chanos]|uniref:Transmembrane emp24 domain-containing protein 5 isoform X2 n=1 Tax=Chanos chanos TaxID=29144 RepID=A0A6J2V7L8_CHACN|nr:transmembrane emp24 domain-containing protein 5-like isoform X2 [Chanos chanos]